jgi:hypothetical protein
MNRQEREVREENQKNLCALSELSGSKIFVPLRVLRG